MADCSSLPKDSISTLSIDMDFVTIPFLSLFFNIFIISHSLNKIDQSFYCIQGNQAQYFQVPQMLIRASYGLKDQRSYIFQLILLYLSLPKKAGRLSMLPCNPAQIPLLSKCHPELAQG